METQINLPDNSANLISPASEPIGTEPTVKPSKQLNYYYRHKADRLAYQRDYYINHHDMILSNQHNRRRLIKVKRANNNNSLLRYIRINSYSLLKEHVCYSKQDRERFMDAYFHRHGRPNLKKRNSRYALNEPKMWFHFIPAIKEARQLTIQQAHFLGLKLGDSLIWKEVNHYTKKIETHTVCFDRSGLDISHESNLPSLTACAIETGLKGTDLLAYFAYRYSVNNYIQVSRGNKLLLTSETENAYREYVKHF